MNQQIYLYNKVIKHFESKTYLNISGWTFSFTNRLTKVFLSFAVTTLKPERRVTSGDLASLTSSADNTYRYKASYEP